MSTAHSLRSGMPFAINTRFSKVVNTAKQLFSVLSSSTMHSHIHTPDVLSLIGAVDGVAT